MEQLFLPNGEHTKLMPGDEIFFLHAGGSLETIFFGRGDQMLSFNSPFRRSVGGENQYPRTLIPAERIRIAKLIASATGMSVKVTGWGGKKTVFQFFVD
jgi:hypothetical protein